MVRAIWKATVVVGHAGQVTFGDERTDDADDDPYLSFKGECEAAFKFYEQCLGGRVGTIFRYAGTSLADQVPADWQDKVMHGGLTVGEQVLMGGDVAPESYEEPKGFSLSIQIRARLTPSVSFTNWPTAAGL